MRDGAGQAHPELEPPGWVRQCYKCNSTMHLTRDCTRFHEILATHEQDDEEARVNACFSDARLTEFRGIVYNNQVETTELGEITSVCITDHDGTCSNEFS